MLIRSVVPRTPVGRVASIRRPAAFAPPVDIVESKQALVFTAELPGLAEADFEVTVDADTLTIRGEKKRAQAPEPEAGRRVLRNETLAGEFSRSYKLPFDADSDSVTASFKNGLLTVTVPKPAEPEVRSIPIATA